MKTLTNLINKLSFEKTIVILIVIVLLTLMSFSTVTIFRYVKRLKSEIERNENNFYRAVQEIKVEKTKNGQLQYSVESLELKYNEAKKFNASLMEEIKNLNIKIKNLMGAVKIEYVTEYRDVPVEIEKQTDSLFFVKFSDDWLKFNQTIRLKTEKNSINLYVDSLNLVMNNDLLIVNEAIYKRSWIFWKKAIGVKVHVTSKNPYNQFQKIESINFLN
jgi:hypothetical protein